MRVRSKRSREYAELPDPPASLQFLQAAQRIMDDNNISMPSNVDEALDFYVTLTTIIEQ